MSLCIYKSRSASCSCVSLAAEIHANILQPLYLQITAIACGSWSNIQQRTSCKVWSDGWSLGRPPPAPPGASNKYQRTLITVTFPSLFWRKLHSFILCFIHCCRTALLHFHFDFPLVRENNQVSSFCSCLRECGDAPEMFCWLENLHGSE